MADPAAAEAKELPPVPSTLPEGIRWDWLPYDRAWIRIYHHDFFTPSALHRRTFGPLHRFDHHLPSHVEPGVCPDGRSVTYLAENLRAAASEVFGDLDPFRVCPNWKLARLRTSKALQVQDLTEAGGMALGTGPWLGSSPPKFVKRSYSQEWARKIYDDTSLDGIRYTGSHDEGACVVLWDRAPELELVRNGTVAYDSPLQEPEIWNDVITAYAETSRSLDTIGVADCQLCQEASEAEAAI